VCNYYAIKTIATQSPKGGDIFYDIGTAGSTPLVLQTLIPSLAFGREKSRVNP
jgi:RNA 3'-terminal phosphate cyclase